MNRFHNTSPSTPGGQTRRHLVLKSLALAWATGVWVTTAGAQPSPPQPYLAPAPIVPAPNGVALPAIANAPGVAAPQGANAPSPIAAPQAAVPPAAIASPKVARVQVALVLQQLQAGTMTPEQAWESGALSLEDVVHAANTFRITDLNTQETESPLLAGVVQLLVQHGEERWLPAKDGAKPQGEPLSDNVRLAIADALSRAHDERAVAVYEDLLAEIERTKDQHPAPRTVGALNHLGSYYWDQGKLQKAVDVFLSGERYSSSPEWAAAIRLDAARVYTQMGDKAKAKELYDQISHYGAGWITVLALYDQALPLMNAGKLDEARAILSRPLNTTTQQMEGNIAQNAWLASLDYQQGKLEDALRHGESVMKAGEGKTFRPGSTKNLFEMGRDIYLRAGGWKSQPIQCDVKEVVLTTNPLQPDKPIYARFRIKTYGDQSVTATVDNSSIQARVLPVNNWQRNALTIKEEESEVIVEVPAQFVGKEKILVLTLQRANHADQAITMPIIFQNQ